MALSCASCTDVQLRRYRNDALIDHYSYALGEEYIEVNGLRIFYQDLPASHAASGARNPARTSTRGNPLQTAVAEKPSRSGRAPDPTETIVIIPGLGTSIDFWQLVIPALTEHYRVVAVDPPGFGKSDKPDVSYSLCWIAEQIVAFLDARGIDLATLMGASLGGHLAVMIALQHPQRADRLILMGSCGAWPPPSLPVIVGLETLWHDPIVVDHLRRNWPDIYHRIVSSHGQAARSLFEYQMALRANAKAYWPEGRAASRALKSIFYHSCRRGMRDVYQPTLLVWGESDRIHLLSEGLYYREHLPDARLVIVPHSAHQVILDQPQAMIDLVLRFMHGGTTAIDDSPEVGQKLAATHRCLAK